MSCRPSRRRPLTARAIAVFTVGLVTASVASQASAGDLSVDGTTLIYRSGGYNQIAYSATGAQGQPAFLAGMILASGETSTASAPCSLDRCPAANITGVTAYLSSSSWLLINEQNPGAVWPVPLTVIGSNRRDTFRPEYVRGSLPKLSFDGAQGSDELSTIPGTPTVLAGGEGNDFLVDQGGDGNQISCGPGDDWVWGPRDRMTPDPGFVPPGATYPADCEHVRLRPTQGRSALVSAESPSTVFVKTSDKGFRAFKYQEIVPIGSTIRAPAKSAYIYSIAGDEMAWMRVLGTRVRLAQGARNEQLWIEPIGEPRCNGNTTRKGTDRPRINVWGRKPQVRTPDLAITADGGLDRGLTQIVVDRQCGGTLITRKRGGSVKIALRSGKQVKVLRGTKPYLVRR